jgi:hypothetical protein
MDNKNKLGTSPEDLTTPTFEVIQAEKKAAVEFSQQQSQYVTKYYKT